MTLQLVSDNSEDMAIPVRLGWLEGTSLQPSNRNMNFSVTPQHDPLHLRVERFFVCKNKKLYVWRARIRPNKPVCMYSTTDLIHMIYREQFTIVEEYV